MFQLFGSENVYSGTNLACGLQTGQLLQFFPLKKNNFPNLFRSPFSGSMFVFQGVWQAALGEYAAFAVSDFNRETLFGFCVDPNPKRPSSDG